MSHIAGHNFTCGIVDHNFIHVYIISKENSCDRVTKGRNSSNNFVTNAYIESIDE